MGVTIYDIAEQADVSIATVSRVLNNSTRVSKRTRERVFAVAEALGYQPHVSAQSLARRKADLVAAVIPMMTNYFFIEVMRGLQDALLECEFDLLVYAAPTMDDVDGQLARTLQRGRSAGVLLFSTPLTPRRLGRLRRAGQPIVLVDSFHAEFDAISVDNEFGGYLAARHLVGVGYRRIGLILANPVSVPAAERRRGYLRALDEAGVAMPDDLAVINTDVLQHGYTEEAGYQAMQTLLARVPRPEAVFVGSDIQALGALLAAQEAGLRVPEDVALLGFDDIKLSAYVGLSTLRQPMYEMGRLAVEKLLRRIEAPDRPVSHTVFSPVLVPRATCGAAADTARPPAALHA